MRAAPAACQRRAMPAGSSPYTVERSKSPCTSLTQRPPWRSIAGMTSNTRDGRHRLAAGARGAGRVDQADEVLVDLQADPGALFGVELGGEDVVVGHDR